MGVEIVPPQSSSAFQQEDFTPSALLRARPGPREAALPAINKRVWDKHLWNKLHSAPTEGCWRSRKPCVRAGVGALQS